MLLLIHMEIKALGYYSALIKGKKEIILINPSEDFLKKDKSSRIVVFTDKSFDGVGLIDDKVLIRGAGEYEIGGIEILGLGMGEDKAIYTIVVDGISVVVLGKLDETLSDKKIEKIEGVDVLLAPISIGDKSSFKLVKEWTKKWGVNYLIPMGENKEMMSKFLDEADEEGTEPIEVLKVDKENLPEGLELKLLKIV